MNWIELIILKIAATNVEEEQSHKLASYKANFIMT